MELALEIDRKRRELAELEARFSALVEGGILDRHPTAPIASFADLPKLKWPIEGLEKLRVGTPNFATLMSIPSRILELFEEEPTVEFDAKDVAARLGVENLDAIRTALARLHERRRIDRSGHGLYRKRGTTPVENIPLSKIERKVGE